MGGGSGEGEGLAGADTVTLAVPLTEPLFAVIVSVAAAFWAENLPVEVIEPPLVVQVKPGCEVIVFWNWSSLGQELLRAAALRLAVPGVTVMLVSVWATVTVTDS